MLSTGDTVILYVRVMLVIQPCSAVQCRAVPCRATYLTVDWRPPCQSCRHDTSNIAVCLVRFMSFTVNEDFVHSHSIPCVTVSAVTGDLYFVFYIL